MVVFILNDLSVDNAFYFLSQALNEDVTLEIKRNPDLFPLWMHIHVDILYPIGGYYWDSPDPLKVFNHPFFKRSI